MLTLIKRLFGRGKPAPSLALSHAFACLSADIDAMEYFRDQPEKFGGYVESAYEHLNDARVAANGS